jgi:hypothetical protein
LGRGDDWALGETAMLVWSARRAAHEAHVGAEVRSALAAKGAAAAGKGRINGNLGSRRKPRHFGMHFGDRG